MAGRWDGGAQRGARRGRGIEVFGFCSGLLYAYYMAMCLSYFILDASRERFNQSRGASFRGRGGALAQKYHASDNRVGVKSAGFLMA